MIKKLIMWFKHITGTNKGHNIFWVDVNGNNCVGFKCECGEIHGKVVIEDKYVDDIMSKLNINLITKHRIV